MRRLRGRRPHVSKTITAWRAGFDLRVQVIRHGPGVHSEDGVQQVGRPYIIDLINRKSSEPAALDHVATRA